MIIAHDSSLPYSDIVQVPVLMPNIEENGYRLEFWFTIWRFRRINIDPDTKQSYTKIMIKIENN